ncbi:flagellar protein FliS [Clostridium cavendishii DSM 21758]|uniref:Flagellar secretion chaperone FliS n=1 Tax=Clostridium cavendishii DSM 21758 TaxID=1121302 RepID=A0A1M6B2J5_9CLOT|nr:flagellar export chaperone FliS [Clostridium cavendishii]SHI42900.1 flagellar protein FliS [Clostridium cavendishii DSM 21758]
MYQTNGYSTYKNNSVTYASREQLLLMLVDGAVKFVKIGRQGIVDNDVKKSHEALVRTQDIFSELMVTLDKKAGEWAINMYKVYEFINSELMKANIKKDLKILDAVIPLIEEVRSTWYQANEIAKRQGSKSKEVM